MQLRFVGGCPESIQTWFLFPVADIENLWESLKKLDAHQKFEFKIDDGGRCEEIELWFE